MSGEAEYFYSQHPIFGSLPPGWNTLHLLYVIFISYYTDMIYWHSELFWYTVTEESREVIYHDKGNDQTMFYAQSEVQGLLHNSMLYVQHRIHWIIVDGMPLTNHLHIWRHNNRQFQKMVLARILVGNVFHSLDNPLFSNDYNEQSWIPTYIRTNT